MTRLAVVLLSTVPLAARPAVFWYSAPVQAGQTVVALGGGWGDTPRVEVAPLPNDLAGAAPAELQPAEVLAGDDAGVQFLLPAGEAASYLFRVGGDAGWSEPVVVNRPEVWWTQGDAGGQATAGGWLRLQGRCLAAGARPARVELEGPGGKPTIEVTQPTPYSLSVAIPADLKPGTYQARVHGGVGGRLGWSEPFEVQVAAAEPDRRPVVNVLDHGAEGRGGRDDTAAVKEAIQATADAGGGVVLFPRGRYQLSDTLELPPGVTLRGEGTELTALLWPDREEPLDAILRGTHHFGVEDLTIYCSNHRHVIAGGVTADEGWGDVKLRRVRVRANAYRGHLKPEEVDARFRDSLKLSTGGGDTVRLGGPNLEVTDCDLYGSGRCLFLSGAHNGLVARNVLTNGRWGWYCLSGSDGLIFEDNEIRGGDLMSTGGGLNCLYGYTASQNVYYARNRLHDMNGWDREAMTSDAGGGAYLGGVKATDGAAVTLAEPISQDRPRDWSGAGLFVLDGTGRGQWRRVISAEGDRVEADRPLEVPVDATSVVSLTMLQRHYLMIDNTFADAGIAIQFYGCAVEHICDGDESTRAGGFHAQARNYHGIQPNLGVQFLNCRVLEGNSYRFGSDNATFAGPSHIGLHAFAPARLMGGVIRGCQVRNNGLLEVRAQGGEGTLVEHVVIEDNEVDDSDLGVLVDERTRNVTVRGNRFTNLVRETLHFSEIRREWDQQRAALLAEPGPLARWSFDQPKGPTADDDTGRGLAALLNGDASFEPGLSGSALRPGTAGFAQVGDTLSFASHLFCLPAVTVSAWVKPDGLAGRYGIVSKRAGNVAAPFILSVHDGAVGFEATDTAGKWSYNFRVPNQVTAGEWQQLAAVAVSGRGVWLYRNGVEVGHAEATTPIVTTPDPLRVGWDAWGGPTSDAGKAAYFPGLIDEVVVWGRALTAEEMAAEYQRVKALAP